MAQNPGRRHRARLELGAMEPPSSKRVASKPGQIHLRIAEVMKRFPEGISGGQIRQELEKEGLKPEDQTHLDRRKRDLKKWFVIRKKRSAAVIDGKKRTVVLYEYAGERKNVTDEGQIGIKLRAEVIRSAHGRCQMCGRTVEQHGAVLNLETEQAIRHGIDIGRGGVWLNLNEEQYRRLK